MKNCRSKPSDRDVVRNLLNRRVSNGTYDGVRRLSNYMEDNGIAYQFPEADQLNNHKDAFGQMMAAFAEKNPDKGLLFVVDELLDYLRGVTISSWSMI